MLLSPLTDDNHSAYSHMLQRAFNTWYCARGWPTDCFGCTPEQGGIFVDFTESNRPQKTLDMNWQSVRQFQ